ncbi:hypothetical protein C8A00DRAFT_15553 [Chaetomidium leptoderma]|uniref:DUF1279 domain-containing protein n=1 Tax=Chaetomidium leptoderma TaxID=669021 RepID=A0AAN6VL01_9PEZI|nr:hypothetical protein C8A00DRAFT_15553 [Chaetomidium leptoderma]
MLRSAFGAFDALLGRSAARGTITRNTAGTRIGAGRTSAKVSAIPWHQRALMSQFRASRAATVTRSLSSSRFARVRTPFLRPKRPFHSTRPRRADASAKKEGPVDEASLSLRERLRKLSREYGWAAVGIYLSLSVLDFPFCFLLVRTVGTEKIAHLEHVVVSNAQKVIPERVQTWWLEYRQAAKKAERERTGETGELEILGHGVEEAEKRSKQEGASLATQLALAYAIHKSFIFIRVPLTAAVTPKVVKVLRSWGWQIGKKVTKPKGKP